LSISIVTTEDGRVAVDIVDEQPFGSVARSPSTHVLYLLSGQAVGHRLVPGPSFLRLLTALPEGDFPRETAAAVAAIIAASTTSRSLALLRFDVTTDTFRWEARPQSGRGPSVLQWSATVVQRLFADDGHGLHPRLTHLFDSDRDRLPAPKFTDLEPAALRAGTQHLAELTRVVLADDVRRSEEFVDHWGLTSPRPRDPRPPGDGHWHKAGNLLEEAEFDALAGRFGAARMNAKLASIYAAARLAGGDCGAARLLGALPKTARATSADG
jgi:hypothetical protein